MVDIKPTRTNMELAWEKNTGLKFQLVSRSMLMVNGTKFGLVGYKKSKELKITMKWAKSDESPYIVTKFGKCKFFVN